ncbi:related to DCG1-involved in nitrogen-catabolite metabolism [Sporisorium reilianum f. sp. reilianum]|uniref:Related to DCG1-involved in nitrogen-catabolite metabolism n=1 Tax=Sporisorium reilianum f. sp. reilianum TaxID=72559 RepID=A0A2N8UD57_9BASI|nr:related to DCG1-involved in nitrogen-catabolite metabolism [Sporisorium reilianum f. sp. reilianum]
MAPVAASTTMAHSASPEKAIYIVNPNSSSVITSALAANLNPQTPPGCTLQYVTGPPSSPSSIQDVSESVISAAETFRALVASSPGADLAQHPASAFLVACFSDHPLVGMLRCKAPLKPALHLLEAAVLHALCAGARFGVLTTGRSVVADVEAGVRRVMGGNSDRYVGTHATGLGVVELQTGSRAKVEDKIRRGAQELVGKGADVIVLGCAGMTGMEPLVRAACEGVGETDVKVVDGAKAGLQILAGLARVDYRS